MARTFDVVVLNIHPTADKTVVVAEVRYTPTQDNVDLPTSGTGRQTIAQVKQQKTIVHVWGDYRDRKKDELSKDPKFRNFAMHEAEQLINNYLNERGLLS